MGQNDRLAEGGSDVITITAALSAVVGGHDVACQLAVAGSRPCQRGAPESLPGGSDSESEPSPILDA